MSLKVYKRLMVGVLSFTLICNLGLPTALAAGDGESSASIVCPHHEHDTDCSYGQGSSCTFDTKNCTICGTKKMETSTPIDHENDRMQSGTTQPTAVTGFVPPNEGIHQQDVSKDMILGELNLSYSQDGQPITEKVVPGTTIQLNLKLQASTLDKQRSSIIEEQMVQFYAGSDNTLPIGDPVNVGSDGIASTDFKIPADIATDTLHFYAEYGSSVVGDMLIGPGTASGEITVAMATDEQGNKYADILEAVLEVGAEGTITLLRNSTYAGEPIPVTKDITLALNGKALNGKVQFITGTVTVTGTGTIENLILENSTNVVLKGGTFTTLTTGGGTLGEALASGYGFQKSDKTWVYDTAVTTLSEVTVREIPMKITKQPEDARVDYGSAATLSVEAETVGGTDEIAYQWYTASDHKKVENATSHKFVLSSGRNAGTYQYYCKLTRSGYILQTNTVTVTVKQAGTSFENGIQVLDANGSKNKNFTYGDPITVKITPKATAASRSARLAPVSNQMALFVVKDKKEIQIAKPQTVENDTTITFIIDTSKKYLASGENTLMVKYIAGDKMASYSEKVKVNLAKRSITSVAVNNSDASAAKVYDGTTAFTGVVLTNLNTTDILSGDSVTTTANGIVDDANSGQAKAFTATDIAIGGTDKDYYSIQTSAVSGTVAITKATPVVTVSAEKKGTGVSGTALGEQSDTFTLTVMTDGIKGEKPNGSVTFKSGENILGTATTTNGTATIDWIKPPAGTHTITAEFTAEQKGNYQSTRGSSKPFDISKKTQTTTVVSAEKKGDANNAYGVIIAIALLALTAAVVVLRKRKNT